MSSLIDFACFAALAIVWAAAFVELVSFWE